MLSKLSKECAEKDKEKSGFQTGKKMRSGLLQRRQGRPWSAFGREVWVSGKRKEKLLKRTNIRGFV